MPNKGQLAAVGIGILVMAIFVGLIVLKQRGSTPHLAGEITQIRTLGMDQAAAVAIVDFRFTNDSRYRFIVQSADLLVVDSKGETRKGAAVAASNTKELFELFPALGTITAESLVLKTRVEPGASRRAMLTARFEISKAELDARKKLVLQITDLDGAVSEIAR